MTALEFFKRKGFAALALCSLCALFEPAAPAGAQTAVSVTVNGSPVNLSPAPLLSGGRVFVPLRGVFEQLGASVVYSNGTINATGNGRTISLQIGSTQAIVDGQTQRIDVAPFIVGESTYVPLRFISESLGAGVDWDDASQTVAINVAGAQQNAQTVVDTIDLEPPPIPVYDQPPVPEPNDIWQPGYWAWGPYGYYWVPGTWVAPPQPGYLWTPGYWNWRAGNYVWIGGYWATAVGFYGGINYGAGYYGRGYVGGQWSGPVFRYNTAVTNVNTTIIHNVYVNKTVINNYYTTSRVSYNGGPEGLRARPTPQEVAVARQPHLGVTAAQEQHDRAAAQDRRQLATVNHNRPPVLAAARPLTTNTRPDGFVPVKPADKVMVPVHAAAPAVRAAPAKVTAAPEAPSKPESKPAEPAYRPQERATPANHPAPQRPAPEARPAVRATPEYHPPVRSAPVPHAPPAHAAPAVPRPAAPKPAPAAASHPHPPEPPK